MDIKIVNDVMLRNDIMTILLTAIIPVAISVAALVISIKSYSYNKKRCKIENAIIQAGKYKDIINQISIITIEVVSNKTVFEIVDKINYTDMNDFTYEEMKGYYSEAEIAKLYEFYMKLNGESGGLPMKLLNTLEEFAMYFNHNIADGETVYQSLHTSYLSTIKYLYYCISKNNHEKKEAEKVYTNVTVLFKDWREKRAKIENDIKTDNEKSKKRTTKRISPKKII